MLRSVTGERIKMGGKKRLCVGLAKRTLQHEFCLAPIRDACILGLDFLKALGAVLDIPAAALKLGRMRIPLAAPPTAEQDRAVATASIQARDQGPAGPEHTPPEGEGITPLPEKIPSQSTPEAVRELWRHSSEGLTEEQSQRLWALLQANLDAFAAREEDCTRTSLVQHQIDTGSTAPIRLHAHRLPIAKQQAAEQKLKEMAESGVIEPSNSPWAAPVVLVKKKDGSWRFCVDYCRLNAPTKADSYPLHRINDALDKVAGSSWFSSLDLRSGYWQVELAPEAREKTAFTLGAGLWQFRVMAFGLQNAPATFERLMERVLAGIPKERCILYLDDLLAHAPTFDEALACLEQVIGAIKAANLRLHPKKCLLLQRKVQFLGHVVSGDGVATDPEKVQSVRHWPTPRDVSELRSFLGLASYYRSNADTLSRRPCLEVECRYCARLEQKEEQGEERVAAVGAVNSELIESCGREEFQKAQGEDPVLRKVLQWKRGGAPAGVERRYAARAGPKSISVLLGQSKRTRGVAVSALGGRCSRQNRVADISSAQLEAARTPGGARTRWGGTLWGQQDTESAPPAVLLAGLSDRRGAICALLRKKGPTGKSRAPLQPLQSGAPMERVAVDVLGPFPRTEAGNRYVLVAMDFFTKWPEAYAVPDQSAVTTAERLVEEFFCRFGLPEELHSNQGRNFESQVMAEVCQRLGVRKTRTTPLHPQSDGLVERFNKTLATQLAILTDKHQRDWDRHLPLLLWLCRAAVQESTNFTPAQLMLGRELRTPTDLVFGLPVGLDTPVNETCYARNLRECLAAVHRAARENQEGASARVKQDAALSSSPTGRGHAAFCTGCRRWFTGSKRVAGLWSFTVTDWLLTGLRAMTWPRHLQGLWVGRIQGGPKEGLLHELGGPPRASETVSGTRCKKKKKKNCVALVLCCVLPGSRWVG
ncbi:hypothetical protein SRHO_G00256610 [Serrasalmus rhombeus]